jgi:pyruvate/2-oxoglutarate dehydrogenase complex dihydrolipoamide acyltransferase (E2) component
MAVEVVMPQMGESVAEGTVQRWLKREGERVEKDEPLVAISTEKVDVEIPSPAAGVLGSILVAEGATVPVNALLTTIVESAAEVQEERGEAVAQEEGEEAAPQEAPSVAPGYARKVDRQVDRQLERLGGHHEPGAAVAGPRLPQDGGRRRITPVVAKLAEEYGVDLREIQGTGIGGRITKKDLVSHLRARGIEVAGLEEEAAAAAGPHYGEPQQPAAEPRPAAPAPRPQPVPSGARPAAAPAPSTVRPAPTPGPAAPRPAPAPSVGGTKRELGSAEVERGGAGAMRAETVKPAAERAPAGGDEPVEYIPLVGMRKAIADHMVLSKRTSPHVTTVAEVDLTDLVEFRAKDRAEFEKQEGFSLTYMPFIVRAAVKALQDFPTVNASMEPDRIVVKKFYHIGVAVSLESGLIVPVIRHADRLDIRGIARAINDLATRARAKTLRPEEYQGGTFSITNPGVYGAIVSTPIINQPQAAILGVYAIRKMPVVRDDQIVIRSIMNLALSYDHRIIDGATAVQYLQRLRGYLESPLSLLL